MTEHVACLQVAVGALDADGPNSFVRLYTIETSTFEPTISPSPTSAPSPVPTNGPSPLPSPGPSLPPTPVPSDAPTPMPSPNCPEGSVLGASGTCEDCAAGYFKPEPWAEQKAECRACPVGKFSDVGASACSVCPGGRFSNRTAAASCTACPAGFIIAENSTDASDHDSVDDCVECGTGERASMDQSVCQACAAGQYSARSSCESCPSGRFSETPEDFVCVACGPGTHAPAPGASSCADCQNGKYAPGDASVNCLDCPAGRSQPEQGEADCVDCGVDFFAAEPGAQACEPCALGFSSTPRAANCSLCQPGYFWRFRDSQPGGCVACPPNAKCDGQLQQPKPDRGYWSDRAAPQHMAEVHRCPRGELCKGVAAGDPFDPCWIAANLSSPACNSDALQCAGASEGVLCG